MISYAVAKDTPRRTNTNDKSNGETCLLEGLALYPDVRS